MLRPRSGVLCVAAHDDDRLVQLAAVLAVGSRAIWPPEAQALLRKLPEDVQSQVAIARDCEAGSDGFDVVLLHGTLDDLAHLQRRLADREGPVISIERLAPGETCVPLERLIVERAMSVNTAAAGGNASLMTIG